MRTAPPNLARSALDAAPDAMIIIDAAGIIRFTNRQVSALFGYEHDEIIGQSIEMLMPERFRARHVGHREQLRQATCACAPWGRGWSCSGGAATAREFPVEISLSPIEDVEPDSRRRRHPRCDRPQADRGGAHRGARGRRGRAGAARTQSARARRSGESGQEPLSRHRQSRSASAAANPRDC